eukprot:UC1_evm1s1869
MHMSQTQCKTLGNIEPHEEISPQLLAEAIEVISNPDNRPVLIHCHKGNHRTGCLVGCFRRCQQWTLTSAFDEYRRFTGDNDHLLDLQCIELFQPTHFPKKALK